ncbi:MAG: DivIVA domain-containing protein [Actinomycetota bacterium]
MNESNAQFRSVLRGYDTAQVDQHVNDLTQAAAAARREAGDLSIQVSKLEAAQLQLNSDLQAQREKARGLEEEQKKAAPPTYTDLGQRIGAMLKLADEEGNELRTAAKADAEAHHALADESARATREGADTYAKETRSAADAESARILEDAKRRSDSILDDADRQATARREEAEAVYERARAKSAAAAADFETTLATRRDTSAQEFAVQIAAAEQQLTAVQQQAEQARSDSEKSLQAAADKSAHKLSEAKAQATAMVSEAKTKADRIRDDSERVLAAASQRRDSINAQLTNVRQMLATLSGGAMVNPTDPAETKPAESGDAKAEPAESRPPEPKPAESKASSLSNAIRDAKPAEAHQDGAAEVTAEAVEAPTNDNQSAEKPADPGNNEKQADKHGAAFRKAGVKS